MSSKSRLRKMRGLACGASVAGAHASPRASSLAVLPDRFPTRHVGIDMTEWNFAAGRVDARLLEPDDRDLYLGLYTDARVMAHIGRPLTAQEAAVEFARTCRANADPSAHARCWRLVHRRNGEKLGLMAAWCNAREPGVGEIGIMLLPAWYARGIGLPALQGLVDQLMRDHWRWGVNEVVGRYAPGHRDAERLVQALGFRRAIATEAQVEWRLSRTRWRELTALAATRGRHRVDDIRTI
ncbi:MAG: N-acetyltransferase [Lysobacteraceae bacterium]|nr:MAG: N-acetyltransferase [Xanthomonadaceae bacterium]